MPVTQRCSTDTCILKSQENGYACVAHPSSENRCLWFAPGADLVDAVGVEGDHCEAGLPRCEPASLADA